MKIKFQNNSDSMIEGHVKKISDHVMELSGVELNLSGFVLCTDNGEVYRDCSDYTTLYRELEGGYQLSNDESVYQEPEPTPEEPVYEPTIEELKKSKIEEMVLAEQQVLNEGIDVDISTGKEHFPLGDKDVLYLLGLQSMVASGEENIPWHNGDENEPCKFYSNSDMKKIQQSAMEFVIYNETKVRDLTRFINSLTDKESVKSITYNTVIPSEFNSEVMEALQSEA